MADDYASPHAPAMTKSERDSRIAEVSRKQGEQQVRDMCEGAAAYRAVVARSAGFALARVLVGADAEFRRRFGDTFDRAVKERGDV